jgi:pimeloyl-ACP methyl ester carboxylesterase
MNRHTVSLDAGGHQIGGIATDLDTAGRPLLVALHGGSYTSAYFDLPGHSLLEMGAANGFAVVALDRPCYGTSAPLPDAEVSFERNAEILDAAIAKLWHTHAAEHSGIVVIGHSIGAGIAIHLAARRPAWPLLGVALSGIHDVAPAHVRAAWDSMPAGQPVVFTPEQRRMFFYGPDWTIEPGIVDTAEISAAPIPLAELLEVVGSWPDEAKRLAKKINVPIQYVAFEFEQLWTIDPQTVQTFAGYFTGAPFVEADLMAGIGHDADHHRAGPAFQLRQLAFALQCAGAAERPPLETTQTPASG